MEPLVTRKINYDNNSRLKWVIQIPKKFTIHTHPDT